MKRILILTLGLLLVTACRWIVTPKGEPEERAKAAIEQPAFERKLGLRVLPDLTVSATLPEALEYAFKASGDIEAAYFDWRAAIERVPQAGALPDPTLEFESLFSGGGGKGFNLNLISLGLSQDIPGRGKREARAELALREAQGAGERFRAAKFSLQRRVVTVYAQLALNEAMIGLTSDSIRLLKETYTVALHRYHEMADTGLADMRKIELEIQTAESNQRGLAAAIPSLAAELNGLLNRKADAPLAAPRLPEITLPSSSTAELFALAVARNADLAALRKDI
ncbi:MAG: TolC family protein, partial [Candidatus Sumerlaeota bacterium]|nr:TolC family protein [Candidatus Sumerlaeota bacterium]